MGKRINIEIPDRLHHELKVEAAKMNKTLKETIIEIFETWTEESRVHGK